MALDVGSLIQGFSNYIWPIPRMTGLVLTLPVISSAVLPARVRLIFVLYLAFLVSGLHPEWPSLLNFNAVGVLGIASEFFIGILMGFIIQFVFQAFIIGGQVIAMQAGLGFATLVDPSSNASVPLLSQFYLMLVSLIFLLIDGHLLMIQYIVESFNTKPLGNTNIGVDTLWQIISFSGWMFKGAIMLALPAIVSLLVVSLSFGIMMKAAPQINIFSVGFPITLLLGILIVFVTLLNFYPHIKALLNEGLNVAKDMVQ